MTDALELDCVIFGGGVAGLWTLDELTRAGHSCLLLEAGDLGAGQTVASQGIIHGGLKYALSGLLSPSARAIAEMPLIWRRCLAGESQPNLAAVRVRSHWCVLWQTRSLRSRLGMMGARAGLRVAPTPLPLEQRPALLRECPGVVACLDEQVIEPWSLITALSERHRGRILRIDVRNGLEFERARNRAGVERIRLINPDTGDALDLVPTSIVLTAGAGNGVLRRMCGLDDGMQRRPLHMVMVRGGQLPALHGHCVDGAATRVTVSATRDFSDQPVWQLGGELAERGVAMEPPELLRHARDELRAVLPQLNLGDVVWATYRVDRAEASSKGRRPSDVSLRVDGNIITAWPTKLALAPRVARLVSSEVDRCTRGRAEAIPSRSPVDWPQPIVALPPWETMHAWMHLD